MDVVLGERLGPIRFGMRPHEVAAAFPEPQVYEDWMGGNLNDSLLFCGLILRFDGCESRGPLPDAKLEEICVHGRSNVLLFERPLISWTKESLSARLRAEGHLVCSRNVEHIGVVGLLEVCFELDGLPWGIELYAGIRDGQ